MSASILLLLLAVTSCFSQDILPQDILPVSQDKLPVNVNPVVVDGGQSGQCPSGDTLTSSVENLKEDISEIIVQSVLPVLQTKYSSCGCSQGDSSWYRIAYLNMSDYTQQCPSTWFYLSTPIRGCGRMSSSRPSCDSTVYSSGGRSYSQVCGRINGYQFASPNGLNATLTKNIGLESYYLDGISLTRGAPGAREHVWSFVNAYYELTPGHTTAEWVCPCMYSNSSDWPYTVPSFIGNNYFCATGNRGGTATGLFTDDPLWDGAGCRGTSTCCQFNQPPWFCTSLPTATTADLEVRICGDQESINDQEYISLIDLYVK